MRASVLALLLLLALVPGARAASVSVAGGVLHVDAGAGEANRLVVELSDPVNPAGPVGVSDAGAPATLTPGPGCASDALDARVTCPLAGVASIDVEAQDGDDAVTVTAPGVLPVLVHGGDGADTVTVVGGGAVRAYGGAGDDAMIFASPALVRAAGGLGDDRLSLAGASGPSILVGEDGDDELAGGPGADQLWGGPGADRIAGYAGADRLGGGAGADALDAGAGADRLAGGDGADQLVGGAGGDRVFARAGGADSVLCGTGADAVTADVLDTLDLACERVDYGPSGLVGPVSTTTGGGRFVALPGQGSVRVDRRIIPDVQYFVRRYHVHVNAGYELTGHKLLGEHPIGLAVDLVPGPGGTWNDVDRLARWAEPRQNHPRWPFRWVGYNGDAGHGRGNHLHLSFMHSLTRPGHAALKVWLFQVRSAVRRARAAAVAPAFTPPSRYVAPERDR